MKFVLLVAAFLLAAPHAYADTPEGCYAARTVESYATMLGYKVLPELSPEETARAVAAFNATPPEGDIAYTYVLLAEKPDGSGTAGFGFAHNDESDDVLCGRWDLTADEWGRFKRSVLDRRA